MPTFELLVPKRIIFAPGASRDLGELAGAIGRHALVVTGSQPNRHQATIDLLVTAGIATTSFAIGNEPAVDDLRRGADISRAAGCDLVVSIGGGSALDSGKAISALTSNTGDIVEYLEVVGAGRPLAVAPVPHIAIPTTAGTGSEVTKNAVVLSEEHKVKVSMRSPLMVPTIALVDPELTHSMPRSVTVSSGLDALTHLLESYVSIRANPLVDPLCEDGIRRAARSLVRAADNGDDRDARSDMSLASLFGGTALANAGLGAVHGLAGVLGGRLRVPHGLACGCLLAAVVERNVSVAASAGMHDPLARFDNVARLLTGSSDATAKDAVTWLLHLSEVLELPSLGEYGLDAEMYPGVCADAARSSSMKGNPVPLSETDLEEILANTI